MKTKPLGRESFLQQYKYAALIYLFLAVYNYFFVNGGQLWDVSGYAYTLHLVDYSVGLHTGVLPGALFYGLFGAFASKDAVRTYVLVLLAVFTMVLSVMLGHAVNAIIERKKTNVLWLVLFFVVGPYTITNLFYFFAYYDMYLFFVAVLFFACVENKIAVYFVPAFYVITVLIHFSSFLTVIPLFTIVLLFKISRDAQKRKAYSVVLGISLFLSLALGTYLLLFQSTNLHYSLDQFHTLLLERGGADYQPDDRAFFDYFFYHTVTVDADISFSTGWDSTKGLFANLLSYLGSYIRFNHQLRTLNGTGWMKQEITKTVISFPFFAGYYSFVIQLFKRKGFNKETIISKAPLFLTLLQLPLVAVAVLFSDDINRWISFAVSAMTVEMIYFGLKDYNVLNGLETFIEKNKPWIVAYLFIVATSVFK